MFEDIVLHIYFDDFFREVELSGFNNNQISIGSDELNDIVLKSPVVESRHAVIKAEGTDINIYNLSKSGLSYNGKKVSEKAVEEGDVFIISSFKSTSSMAAIMVKNKNPLYNIEKKFSTKSIQEIKIGKSQKNHIIYSDQLVSNEHAKIYQADNGEYFVRDLKSSNGTYLNGKRTYEGQIKPGDIIHICGNKIIFTQDYLVLCNAGKGVQVKDIEQIREESVAEKPQYPYFQRPPRLIPEMPKGEIEISSPPSISSKPQVSWPMILLPPALMATTTVISGMFMKSNYMYISLVMTVGTLGISILNYNLQVKKFKKDDKTRNEKYLQHLHEKRKELEFAREQQRNGTQLIHPDIKECIRRVQSIDRRLWERTIQYSDFMAPRIGMGKTPLRLKIRAPEQRISIETDNLSLEPQKLVEEFSYINNIPVSLPLYQMGTCGYIGIRQEALNNIRALVMQLAAHHFYEEVKIIAVYSKEEECEWEWMRWLPHVWDDSRQMRFMAKDRESVHNIFSMFYDIIKEREFRAGDKDKHINSIQLPHFVFLLGDIRLLENEAIMTYLAHNCQHLGVSTIYMFDRMEFLPKDCHVILDFNSKTAEMIERAAETVKSEFTPDKVSIKDSDLFARRMAPIRMKQMVMAGNLPNRVTMMELLGVREVTELDVKTNWQENMPYKSLAAPLGIRIGGEKIQLDLHEKVHGPHGLVAGTTGSGKSEILQSLIISMAINYHPHEVAFVLIDYKGGGMANAFIDLPHLVGTITNLGGNQINRALVSIKSELKRRQTIFGDYGVNHIDSYQKLYRSGKAKEPLPHLIIIADEFAELKSDQPEFMRELVSAARVGRSLGVHLILATQKPAGIVDEQIWSNSRFKLCLKVQDARDSQEVIKKPDAADIKQPGRAYIQVGNNEIFELFQSAWSGADYDPEASERDDDINEIYEVDINGARRKLYSSASIQRPKKEYTQLQVLVRHLSGEAEKNNIVRLNGPWMPPMPEKIVLKELLEKDGHGWNGRGWIPSEEWICPIIGLVDDPEKQTQYPLKIDLGKEGHLLVYGSPGYGKTTLLQTLAASLALSYTPEEVNIYFMDFGSRTLSIFSDMPHCGGVIMMDESEKLDKFIKFIFRELDNRKKQFADKGISSLYSYRQATGEKLSAIVILIDNISALSELYPSVEESLVQITREGGNIGIHVVITASTANAIRFKLSANFKMALALQMADKADYTSIVGRTNGLEPSPNIGRGLVKANSPLEYQTALAVDGENELERSINLKALIKEFDAAWQGAKAKQIPIMPETVYFRELLVRSDVKKALATSMFIVPTGLSDNDMEPVYLDLATTPQLLITGNIQSGKSNFQKILAITLAMRNSPEKFAIHIIDSASYGLFPLSKLPHVKNYINSGEQLPEFVESIKSLLDERKEELNEARMASGGLVSEKEFLSGRQLNVILIDDFNEFMQIASSGVKDLFEQILKKDRNLGVSIVIGGAVGDINSSWEGFAKALKDLQAGMLFGFINDQQIFNIRLPYGTTERQKKPGDGYFIAKGSHTGMKTALIENSVLKAWVDQLVAKYKNDEE
ncbi:type VII secretion protein EssC [Pseudobacteroides cellulosolvens]|uniref:FHA domain containing protein n=1 Tax=Pseudobacteroides cellulosolvens ATCC 35603 = DSM 2933 TaxID=398512 RepID=A0A0L6JNZ6_9FIRM|nr:type VII secretion protein EssC [Pseudobacteroides cellulosolvens]KNY27509.1 FHA domain containing protein [Pseudobacteroides cellulosolvens ATCC 35603 = DSM 2933]